MTENNQTTTETDDEYKYYSPGPVGKQCKDCVNFIPGKTEGKGKCLEIDVDPKATCKDWKLKKKCKK